MPELHDLKLFSTCAFADEAAAATVRAARGWIDGVWNAGDDGERWGHTDVMYGSLTRSPAVSACHEFRIAGRGGHVTDFGEFDDVPWLR